MQYQFVRNTMTSVGIARIGQVLELSYEEGAALKKSGRCVPYQEPVLSNTAIGLDESKPIIKRGRKAKNENQVYQTY